MLHAVVGYPDIQIEKMRLQLALQDWDQTLETAHRYEYTLELCSCMHTFRKKEKGNQTCHKAKRININFVLRDDLSGLLPATCHW